jgi:hypothetical protein
MQRENRGQTTVSVGESGAKHAIATDNGLLEIAKSGI